MKSFSLFFILCILLLYPATWAKGQYPTIPDEVKEEGNRYLQKVKEQSDAAWEKALPVIMEEARKGRPYVPWASYPLDLVRADIPAFPGAEGGGMYTPGGRGGKVLVVTSLDDSGPGSFREACETGGARIIVFAVGGTIHLKSPVLVRAPYLTIAGQTAPGDGICITGETVSIETHDVVIRHMRFRRGATWVANRDDALGGDAMGNIMIDHCSVSWGLDESISIYRNMYDIGDGKRLKLPAVNITVQNTIISETLDTYNHAFGSTLGGLNSTFMRNIWANNVARNPSIGMHGDFTFVNNVIFNWWNRTADGGDNRSLFNFINNYYKPGPMTPQNNPVRHRILKPESSRSRTDGLLFGRAYVHGNITEGNDAVTRDNWAGGVQIQNLPDAGTYKDLIKVDKPFAHAHISIMDAQKAFDFALENAGATWPKRDVVDSRIVKEVRTGIIERPDGLESDLGKEYVQRRLSPDSYKKGIVYDLKQVGGFPEYKGGPAPIDSDSDGMPDDWEKRYGLNPFDPSDANGDLNGDGYTNIEKYINGINPKKKVDWKNLKNNIDTLQKKKGGLLGKH